MSDEPSPPISEFPDDATSEAEFRSLAAVRDLIAGLSRPEPPDLTEAILHRIAARQRVRMISRVAAVVLLATACGLAVHSAGRPRPDRAVAITQIEPTVAPATPTPAPAVAIPTTTVAASAREFVGPPDERSPIGRRLLDRPGPIRVFLATAPHPAAAAELAVLLGLSSHRDFHRFDLPTADRERGAVVFAAELDPGELKTLRMRLADGFPDEFVERESPLPLLADVVRDATATTLRGDPAAEFLMPRRELALRLPSDGAASAESAPPRPTAEPNVEPGGDDGPCRILIWLPASSD